MLWIGFDEAQPSLGLRLLLFALAEKVVWAEGMKLQRVAGLKESAGSFLSSN